MPTFMRISHYARRSRSICLLTWMIVVIDFSGGWPSPSSVGMVPVPRAKLCVTEGAVEELKASRLAVTVPKMRAFVAAATTPSVETRLTYLGPTRAEARLGSGELRRQVGLKLRAQDGCNLVYAMWRIEPQSKLVVSVKRTPGLSSSSECENRGSRNIKPRRWSPVPRVSHGDSHTLYAEMLGSEMRVSGDVNVGWEVDLGPEVHSFDGPVGVRTDNGRFEFEFLVEKIGAPIPCRAGDTEGE
jgi:hypothetical protein